MNTCGSCQFFGERITTCSKETDYEMVPTKYAYCTRPFFADTAGCREPEKLDAGPACVVDGSGYFAALCVSDEFGCNQWSARTSEAVK